MHKWQHVGQSFARAGLCQNECRHTFLCEQSLVREPMGKALAETIPVLSSRVSISIGIVRSCTRVGT